MKKLFAVLLILALMLCAVGCQTSENPGSDVNLESEIIKTVKSLYPSLEYFPEDGITIDSFGTYNGCTVCYINGVFGYAQAFMDEKVGAYTFQYSTGQTLLAHKDGQLKIMPEAYELGWLDDDAVKQIYEKHKQKHPVIYDLTPYTKAGAATVYGIEESVIDEYHKNYPKICEPPAKYRGFAEDRVIICVYPFANAHEFTPEDFSILQDSVNVQVIAVEPLSNVSSDTQAEEPTRLLALILKDGSRNDVINAVSHLQARDDIYYAVPDYVTGPN